MYSTLPFSPRPAPSGRHKRFADVNVVGGNPGTVVLRHEQREAAPATAGFDDALAGFQLELAADVMHLRLLRLFKRYIR
jgi:hypothetical protein